MKVIYSAFRIQSDLLGNYDNEQVAKGVYCNGDEQLVSASAAWVPTDPGVDAYNFSSPFILLFCHYYR